MSRNDRFLKACRREAADCTPVWLMRQAGRYMASYREMRRSHSLHEMFRTPDIATTVTLQPITEFELDAAIIFADILLPLEGMGIKLEFAEKEGPRIHNPVRTAADVEALRIGDPEEDLGYVLAALRQVRTEIDGKVPLIGFAGAPFTLASYAIEGAARNFLRTKGMMYESPDLWHRLMEKLSRVIGLFLQAQVRAGAQVIAAVRFLGRLSQPRRLSGICSAAQPQHIPVSGWDRHSHHPFRTGTADLLPMMRDAGL